MFDHSVETQPETNHKSKTHEELNAWANLMQHPYWSLNEDFIKANIASLEREMTKLVSKNNLDNAIATVALQRAIRELNKVLTSYRLKYEEKIRYDKEVAENSKKEVA